MSSNNNFLNILKSYCNIDKLNIIKDNKDTSKTKNYKDTSKTKNNKFIPKTKKDLTDAITCYMTDKKLALNIFGDIYTWDLSKINVSFYMIYLLIKNFKNVKKLFLE